MSGCRPPADTPMDLNKKLWEKGDTLDTGRYHWLLGKLVYSPICDLILPFEIFEGYPRKRPILCKNKNKTSTRMWLYLLMKIGHGMSIQIESIP